MARRRSAVLADLRTVYDDVPAVDCKGLCQTSCTGPIPASRTEREAVAQAGVPLPVLRVPCGNLDEQGHCSVYEVRPVICRLWGAVENMPCPHGCRPGNGLLTRAEGGTIVARVVEIVGEAV